MRHCDPGVPGYAGVHAGSDSHPLRRRGRRPPRRRGALPLVYEELRKLAAARLAEEKPGPDPAGHRARPRGLFAAGRKRSALERPRPFLRRRGRGDAAHPRRERPPQGRRRSAAAAVSAFPSMTWRLPSRSGPTISSTSMRPSTASRSRPDGRGARQVALLRGPDHSRGRGRTRPRAANGGRGLGLCPGLAARPVEGSRFGFLTFLCAFRDPATHCLSRAVREGPADDRTGNLRRRLSEN